MAKNIPGSRTNPEGIPQEGGSNTRGTQHQESRDHNKHNDPGQSGHKPQKHNPAQEKH